MTNRKKSFIFCICSLFFIIVSLMVAFLLQKSNEEKYNEANNYFKKGNYSLASEIYLRLGNYKDSTELTKQMKILSEQSEIYLKAQSLLTEKKYEEAIVNFEKINVYKDSSEKLKVAKYNLGIEYFNKGEYENAKKLFVEVGDYLESNFYLAQIEVKTLEKSQEILYKKADLYFQENNYKDALDLYEEIADYKNSNELISECKKQLKRQSHNNIMASGLRNSIVITKSKTIKAAGLNTFSQLNVANWENIVSVDLYGSLTIGLQENGNVKVTGTYDKNKITNLDDWCEIIDVAAGEQFVVGLEENTGRVKAIGHSSDGQLKVDDWEDIIAIDAGSSFTVGLTANKELKFAGLDNGQEESFKRSKDKWKDVVNISAGGGEKNMKGTGHTVGLKSDGTLVAVGDNSYGQCDFSDTEKWSDIVKVATGEWYTVGLKSNGTVVMTGENFPKHKYIDEEILQEHADIVDISAGGGQTMLLTDEGEIICFGFDDEGKDQLNGFKGAMIPKY